MRLTKLFTTFPPLKNPIAIQFYWIAMERFFSFVFGFFILFCIVRIYGPSQMGVFAVITAIHSMWILLVNFGFQDIIRTRISKDTSSFASEVTYATLTRFCLFAAFYPLYITCLFLWFQEQKFLYPLLILSCSPLFLVYNLVESGMYAINEAKRVAIIRVRVLFLAFLLKLLIVFNKLPLVYYFSASLFEYALAFLAFFYTYRQCYKQKIDHTSFTQKASKLLQTATPHVISGFSILAFMKTDQLMLSSLAGSDEAGIYFVAAQISNYWLMLPTMLILAYLPTLAKDHVETSSDALFQKLYDTTTTLYLVSLVIVLLGAEHIIEILYGSQYQQSASILRIHFAGALFVLFRVISGKHLLIIEKLHISAARSILALILNIVLNYYYIPVGGAAAAAVTSLFTLFFIGLVSDLFFTDLQKHLVMKIKSFSAFLRISST